MRYKRLIGATIISSLLVVLCGTVPVLAAEAPFVTGGNNSSDYQPPTRNPQDNVAGLDAGPANLQPLPTVNQTSLPAVGDLRVQGVQGNANPNTTKTDISKPEKNLNLWPIIIIGVLTVAAIIYVVAQPDPRQKPKKPIVTEAVVPEKVTKPVKKTTKKKSSKKKNKRKK